MNSKEREAVYGKVETLSVNQDQSCIGTNPKRKKRTFERLPEVSIHWLVPAANFPLKLQVPVWAVASYCYYVTKLLAISGQLPSSCLFGPYHLLKNPPLYFSPSQPPILFDPSNICVVKFKEPNITAIKSEYEVLTFHRVSVSAGLRCHACQQLVWQSRSVSTSQIPCICIDPLAPIILDAEKAQAFAYVGAA